jgi:hypothetical protein
VLIASLGVEDLLAIAVPIPESDLDIYSMASLVA